MNLSSPNRAAVKPKRRVPLESSPPLRSADGDTSAFVTWPTLLQKAGQIARAVASNKWRRRNIQPMKTISLKLPDDVRSRLRSGDFARIEWIRELVVSLIFRDVGPPTSGCGG